MTPIQFTGDLSTLQLAGYRPDKDQHGYYLSAIGRRLYLSVGCWVVTDNGVCVKTEEEFARWQAEREVEETLWNRSAEMAA